MLNQSEMNDKRPTNSGRAKKRTIDVTEDVREAVARVSYLHNSGSKPGPLFTKLTLKLKLSLN